MVRREAASLCSTGSGAPRVYGEDGVLQIRVRHVQHQQLGLRTECPYQSELPRVALRQVADPTRRVEVQWVGERGHARRRAAVTGKPVATPKPGATAPGGTAVRRTGAGREQRLERCRLQVAPLLVGGDCGANSRDGDEPMSEDGDPLSARLGSRGPSTSSRTRDERVESANRLALSRHFPWSATISCREAER